MNTISGLRPLDLPLAGGHTPGWPAPAGSPPRWLDGLAGGGAEATLTADLLPDAHGLGPEAHAERVLGALLAP